MVNWLPAMPPNSSQFVVGGKQQLEGAPDLIRVELARRAEDCRPCGRWPSNPTRRSSAWAKIMATATERPSARAVRATPASAANRLVTTKSRLHGMTRQGLNSIEDGEDHRGGLNTAQARLPTESSVVDAVGHHRGDVAATGR